MKRNSFQKNNIEARKSGIWRCLARSRLILIDRYDASRARIVTQAGNGVRSRINTTGLSGRRERGRAEQIAQQSHWIRDVDISIVIAIHCR